MNTNKLVNRLESYFDLSKKKQRKKHDKLLEIIDVLEKKKSRLLRKARKEREADPEGSRYQELQRELQVISGLISKANKKAVKIEKDD